MHPWVSSTGTTVISSSAGATHAHIEQAGHTAVESTADSSDDALDGSQTAEAVQNGAIAVVDAVNADAVGDLIDESDVNDRR
jgi:hypothetical protein